MMAKWVQLLLGFKVRIVCDFGRRKQAQSNRFVVNFDLRKPLAVFFADARKAAFVVYTFTVLRVLSVCGFSQVTKSVVGADSVDMVNLANRPFAVDVQPSQSMRGVQRVIQPDTGVPVLHSASGFIAGATSAPRHVPGKNAGVAVILDQILQAGLRKLCGSHASYYIKQAGRCQA